MADKTDKLFTLIDGVDVKQVDQGVGFYSF